VLAVAAVEDVERAVVARALQVLRVVLHLHLHRVAIVVLAALELLVAVLSLETLQGPLLARGPALLGVEQHHGLVGTLEAVDELLGGHPQGVHAFHVVLTTAMTTTTTRTLISWHGAIRGRVCVMEILLPPVNTGRIYCQAMVEVLISLK